MAEKKTPEESVSPPTTTESKRRFNAPNFSKKYIFIVSTVLLLVLLAAGAFVYVKNDKQASKSLEKKYGYIKPDTSDYTQMTDTQIATELKANENLNIEDLVNKPIKNSSFKDFNQAYAVAQALSGIDKYDKSLEAFKVAEAKAPANVFYTFYFDYADTALYAGKPELAKQVEDRVVQKVNQSNLSDGEKKAFADKINLRQLSRS